MSDKARTLLPCPFCGGEVRLHLDDWIGGRAVEDPECYIECETVTCIYDYRDKYRFVHELIACWNKRALQETPMSDALQRLIDAVEAGSDAPFHDLTFSQLDTFGQRFIDLTQQANRGDMNAAKALHEAMLPGWFWGLGSGIRHPYGAGVGKHGDRRITAEADNPVRAWLLATLKACQHVQKEDA